MYTKKAVLSLQNIYLALNIYIYQVYNYIYIINIYIYNSMPGTIFRRILVYYLVWFFQPPQLSKLVSATACNNAVIGRSR